MAYPFPEYTVNKAEKLQCPMPHQVDGIQTYLQCQATVSQCQLAAAARAHRRGNPHDVQFAEYFNSFANQDRGVQTHDNAGNGTFQYWGGCKLLAHPRSKETLWPAAKEALKDQVYRFQAGQPSSFAGDHQSASVQCSIQDGRINCL